MRHRHPSGLSLSRFADGELDGRRTRAVALHLQWCGKCREYVQFIRALALVADEPKTEQQRPMPDSSDYDLATEVLRRRQDGERIALITPAAAASVPTGDYERGARRGFAEFWRVGLGIAAGFLLFAMAGVFLFDAPSAEAGHSQLKLSPALPVAGSVVNVSYSPASFLAGYDSLRLRTRSRTEDTPLPRVGIIGDLRTATLKPAADGTYRGQIEVRPDEFFLAAAVEDFSGQHLDTNFGRLWEVLVAAGDGRPSIASLEARYRVLEANNFVQALAWSTELVDEYPQSPFGWTLLLVYQSLIEPRPLPDSIIAFHEAKLRKLIAEQQVSPDADVIARLADYAGRLGNHRRRDSLFAAAERMDPNARLVRQWRRNQVWDSHLGDQALLGRAGQLWDSGDGHDMELVLNALYLAARTEDADLLHQWVERGLAIPGHDAARMASRVDDFDFALGIRIRLRLERLAELGSAGVEDRPLDLTVDEFRRELDSETRRVQAALAHDLAQAGETAVSMDLLSRAAAEGWDPAVLRAYADAVLAAGDTAKAMPVIGVLIVDPVSGEAASRRYDQVLTRHVKDRGIFRHEALAEYRHRVLTSRVIGQRLSARTKLAFADGHQATAGEILAGAPSVIFIFEPEIPGISSDVRTLQARVASTAGEGRVRVLPVARRTAGNLAASEDIGPIAVERNYALSQPLKAFGAETYVILDSELNVVRRTNNLETALRVVTAL